MPKYRPYRHLSVTALQTNLAQLKREVRAIKYGSPRSGQISNYYAPAIHHHEEELRFRGLLDR